MRYNIIAKKNTEKDEKRKYNVYNIDSWSNETKKLVSKFVRNNFFFAFFDSYSKKFKHFLARNTKRREKERNRESPRVNKKVPCQVVNKDILLLLVRHKSGILSIFSSFCRQLLICFYAAQPIITPPPHLHIFSS